MSRPVIISAALTGGGDTPRVSPYVPVSPDQIANEALAARAAGAAIAHIHVRDPASGNPSVDPTLYREVVRQIRASGSDVLINLTTGAGGRFVPDESDPNRNAAPTILTPDARIQHVLELRPDICSLDVGSMDMRTFTFINFPSHVERMARAIFEAGVKPELEVFDLGHLVYARHLYERAVIASPPWLQLCLGVPWGGTSCRGATGGPGGSVGCGPPIPYSDVTGRS